MEPAQTFESPAWSRAKLGPAEFRRLAQFVEGHCGIQMPPSKRVMLESRLKRRLRAVGVESFREYCQWVFDTPKGEAEWPHLIDEVSTNKTDFFREADHFRFLVERVIPELVRKHGAGIRSKLAVWSAGCSSGEEPYTLAMVLNEVAEGLPGFGFSILATDIAASVLQKAKRAVYAAERVEPVPMVLRRKYLLRSRDPERQEVRMKKLLQEAVRFRQLNFMDEDFGLREKQHVIFCRNVMIYFDKATQERLLGKFCRHLVPKGFVFLGHSESINGLDVPLTQVAPTVYQAVD